MDNKEKMGFPICIRRQESEDLEGPFCLITGSTAAFFGTMAIGLAIFILFFK